MQALSKESCLQYRLSFRLPQWGRCYFFFKISYLNSGRLSDLSKFLCWTGERSRTCSQVRKAGRWEGLEHPFQNFYKEKVEGQQFSWVGFAYLHVYLGNLAGGWVTKILGGPTLTPSCAISQQVTGLEEVVWQSPVHPSSVSERQRSYPRVLWTPLILPVCQLMPEMYVNEEKVLFPIVKCERLKTQRQLYIETHSH